jgi:hypothetical protein
MCYLILMGMDEFTYDLEFSIRLSTEYSIVNGA